VSAAVLPAGGPRESAVILDARAGAGRRDHLKVEIGALFQPLRFQQFAFRVQFLQPHLKLEADRLHRLFHRRAGGDVVAVGVNADLVQLRPRLAGQGSNSLIASTSSPKKLMRHAMSS
jgi:hypothetical protein